jgi:hypothetical protein
MENLFYFERLTRLTIGMAFMACVIMAPALMVFVEARRRSAAAAAQPMEAF